MQYKVLKIEEDMDFGCEERQPGEALMSVVLMLPVHGNKISLIDISFIKEAVIMSQTCFISIFIFHQHY